MNTSRLQTVNRMALEAAQRRRRIAVWIEHLEAMERTPARTLEEQTAKAEALELMARAAPYVISPEN